MALSLPSIVDAKTPYLKVRHGSSATAEPGLSESIEYLSLNRGNYLTSGLLNWRQTANIFCTYLIMWTVVLKIWRNFLFHAWKLLRFGFVFAYKTFQVLRVKYRYLDHIPYVKGKYKQTCWFLFPFFFSGLFSGKLLLQLLKLFSGSVEENMAKTWNGLFSFEIPQILIIVMIFFYAMEKSLIIESCFATENFV